jgi:hypothetical protein
MQLAFEVEVKRGIFDHCISKSELMLNRVWADLNPDKKVQADCLITQDIKAEIDGLILNTEGLKQSQFPFPADTSNLF